MKSAVNSLHAARAPAVGSGGGGAGAGGGCREQPATAASTATMPNTTATRARPRRIWTVILTSSRFVLGWSGLFENVGHVGVQANQHVLCARGQERQQNGGQGLLCRGGGLGPRR